MTRPRPWCKRSWAVEFSHGNDRFLIGEAWHKPRTAAYTGEPPRCLLFETRAQARQWCRDKLADYAGRQDDLRHWRFRAVRVTETIAP